MLVDGAINIEGKCSSLNCSRINNLLMSRITNLNNRHHDKEKETSINIYVGLRPYSTVRSRLFILTWYMHIVE